MAGAKESHLVDQNNQFHYPPCGPRFHYSASILGVLLVGSIYLLGWVANHMGLENPIVSIWAAGLYAGYILIAALLIRSSLHNHRAGYPWRRSLPQGYGLSLVGIAIFALELSLRLAGN